VVTFFGENHADRRERLREVVARLELDEEEAAEMQVNILLIICLYDCVTCLSVWSSDLL
jgi:hypothetical protein